jgi:hypothetical protein
MSKNVIFVLIYNRHEPLDHIEYYIAYLTTLSVSKYRMSNDWVIAKDELE